MEANAGELKHLSTLQEKKATAIPHSSGERTADQPKPEYVKPACVAMSGCGASEVCSASASQKCEWIAELLWKGRPIEGDSPVSEIVELALGCPQVPRDTGNPAGIWEDHLPRLNTTPRPIVNQYREGKVKSTPVRGVK